MEALVLFILGLPLIGSILPYAFQKSIRRKISCGLTTFCVGISFVLSAFFMYFLVLNNQVVNIDLMPWIELGGFSIRWSIMVDTLSAVMFCVVTFVSLCVHFYSIGYMSKDKTVDRFMAFLSLFTFMMLLLVSASNLLQLFVGWEGVGLCSYLLIGFWFEKERASKAGYKAFVVNRIGDFFFVIGIAIAYFAYGSLSFSDIFNNDSAVLDGNASLWVCSLFFIGAMAKSAQIGLHVWLPDAMEGPTPVSALIHAATMVTAGVFLLIRFSPVLVGFEGLNTVILYVGAITAFYAGTVALAQNDLKRIIAFSTCSQLGYMMMAIGVTAYSAALFHLVTHAFFKALLFLSAGSVIKISKGEHDIRKMPDIRFKAPVTYGAMLIGSMALIGAPFLSGFYSKDLVLESIMHSKNGMIPYVIGVVSVALTAIYSVRMFVYVFHNKAEGMDEVEVNESSAMIWIPMCFLVIPSIGAGYLLNPFFTHDAKSFFAGSIILQTHDFIVEGWQKWLPTGIACICFLAFLYFFIKQKSAIHRFVKTFRWGHQLLVSKWYFDEFYQITLVKGFEFASYKMAAAFESKVIDKYGPNGIARLFYGFFRVVSKVQTGAIYNYVLYIFCGFAIIIGIYILR